MGIRLVCSCGKKLSAPDHLAGRAVACPACKTVLNVPSAASPTHATPSAAPSTGLAYGTFVVACSCGQQFAARPEMAGMQTYCTTCGQLITVPNPSGTTVAPQVSQSANMALGDGNPQRSASAFDNNLPGLASDPFGGNAATSPSYDPLGPNSNPLGLSADALAGKTMNDPRYATGYKESVQAQPSSYGAGQSGYRGSNPTLTGWPQIGGGILLVGIGIAGVVGGTILVGKIYFVFFYAIAGGLFAVGAGIVSLFRR